MLESVEWGEYRLGDLFGSATRGKRLKSSDRMPGKLPFVTAGEANTGISAFIGNDVDIFSANTITIDMFGSAKYRNYSYGADDHVAVVHTQMLPKGAVCFITSAIHKVANAGQFHYGRNFYAKDAEDLMVSLPSHAGVPDFEFMEKFIAELKALRIAELKAYLFVTGLKDYTLTPEEEQALQYFDSNHIEWDEYKMGELFRRRDTEKLFYKAKELPKEPKGEYTLPCLTSSFLNQGLNYYAPRKKATILKDVISIPSNSDVYRAYYQSRDFTVLSDAYAIEWAYGNKKMSREQYLFLVSSINQVTDLPIYSYKNKLGGWTVVKDKRISLPTLKGEIDYALMETLISAIQKMVIKDVVLYADREIEETKQVIEKGIK